MIGDHAMPLKQTNSIKIKQIDPADTHSSGHGTYMTAIKLHDIDSILHFVNAVFFLALSQRI